MEKPVEAGLVILYVVIGAMYADDFLSYMRHRDKPAEFFGNLLVALLILALWPLIFAAQVYSRIKP